MQRRQFMTMALGSIVYIGSAPLFGKAYAADAPFEALNKSKDEWKKSLSPEQYHILREEGTEAPFTSVLVDEHREGMFHCAGCNLPLFKSQTKFDSGTGWPSFFDCIKGHIETKEDNSMFMKRIEYHCAKCGGHHGHLFDDGPKPTGLRYCSNGAVLTFKAKGT